MHQALSWLLAIVAVALFLGTIERARQAHGGTRKAARGAARKDGFLASRRRVREMREKHRLDGVREEDRHRHRLTEQEERDERARQREEERERRQQERYGDDGPPPRRNIRNVIRLKPEKPDGKRHPDDDCPPAPVPPDEEKDGVPGAPPPAPGSPPPPAPPRHPGPSSPPPRPPQSPPAPAPANGGTAAVSTPAIPTTAVEDILLGVDRRADTGIAGNVHAKRRALAEIAAVLARCDSAITRMQRSMNEEGLYGPEITDPMTGPADQAASAARGLTEVDSVILSLLRTPAGELAGSGYQVPHHAELSETGGR